MPGGSAGHLPVSADGLNPSCSLLLAGAWVWVLFDPAECWWRHLPMFSWVSLTVGFTMSPALELCMFQHFSH